MGAGPSLGETGVRAQSVVVAFVAGVHTWGVTGAPGVRGRVITLLLGGVMVGLGSQSGWEGVAGRPASGRVGLGLATRGAASLLDGVTAGGAVGMEVCARGTTSALGGVTAGSDSARCFHAVT
jgi:hypothetical protein